LLNFVKSYTLKDFFFDLPDDLIAQTPEEERDNSKLLLVKRETGSSRDSFFYNLDEFLFPGDLLVFNKARVIAARLFFKRESGGEVEFILSRPQSDFVWLVISNRTKRLHLGEILKANRDSKVSLKILGRVDNFLQVEFNQKLTPEFLESIGEVPLPPYIKRKPNQADSDRYQTIFAKESGAVAAPTAGLHFTEQLLARLKEKGVKFSFLTLFVSWGTFQPVRKQDLSQHQMHSESYFLPEETAIAVNLARKEKRRVVAVGTTSLRVLESTYLQNQNIPGRGETNIFIYPPYKIKSINGLITNFHTPYSTLLMLVSSFLGYDKTMKIYKEAVKKEYRFFSYGDAMFIS